MQIHVSPPGIAHGQYDMTTDEVAAVLCRRHPELAGHPDFLTAARAVTGRRRRRIRPCPDDRVHEPYAAEDRHGDLRVLMGQACRRALTSAGTAAQDVGGLVVVQDPPSAESDPFLDSDVVLTLGLPSTTARVPLTGLSSTGAVHALIVAEDMARLGKPVLVVAAGIHQPLTAIGSDTATPAALARQLMVSDGAAAVVVSGGALAERGLVIDATWQYAHRDTQVSAQAEQLGCLVKDHPGFSALPWLRPGQTPPGFALVHPGGPAPLHSLSQAGPLPQQALEPSIVGIAEDGDSGAAAVLQLLARLHQRPPAAGSHGLLLGLAPGHLAAACRVRWTTSAIPRQKQPKSAHEAAF
ncbi:hypothetical protein [Streptomyces sp. NRRL B-1347]|uniref:hypothetical protein n=1 Tax=Streptomyces sp. NRRL B-1347 TaxID=1476877 RepID=UPI0004C6FFAD|nr:hypothetical protein [Streptomyces sp. NRRL B-1347]